MVRPLVVTALALTAAIAGAAPSGWHASLDDGLRAAQRSGKPVFLVTTWAGKA